MDVICVADRNSPPQGGKDRRERWETDLMVAIHGETILFRAWAGPGWDSSFT